jgi:hypothetical protein
VRWSEQTSWIERIVVVVVVVVDKKGSKEEKRPIAQQRD